MFELRTAIHAIDSVSLLVYYVTILIIYAFFLRGVKFTPLSLIIILLFNYGIVLLFDPAGTASKILFLVLPVLIMKGWNIKRLSSNDVLVLALFAVFTGFHFIQYQYYSHPFLWPLNHYIKYLIPVVIYLSVNGTVSPSSSYYYLGLTIRLLQFQVAFSVLKMLVIGFRENIVGSITNEGGSIAVTFPLLGVVLLWLHKKGVFKLKDYLIAVSLLTMAIASNKRAVWFLFPMVLLVLSSNLKQVFKMRRIGLALVIAPIILYSGLRLNPTLNPDRVMWGTFDPNYAIDYALNYSGVSEDKAGTGQGRWGASMAIVESTLKTPLSGTSIWGLPKNVRGRADYSDFNTDELGFQIHTGVSGIGSGIVRMGWPASMALFFTYFTMIMGVKTRSVRNALMLLYLWDYLLYSGVFIFSYGQTILLVLTIVYAKYTPNSHKPPLHAVPIT